jgi:hypothetical protein
MNDQHLKPVCPHCGRQDCSTEAELWCHAEDTDAGQHARDREDYLTDLIAEGEEREAWWKQQAWDYKAELQRRADKEDARQAECQGEQQCVSELAYRKAVSALGEAELLRIEQEDEIADRDAKIRSLRTDCGKAIRERDEARAEARSWIRHYNEAQEANAPLQKELDALRTRALAMRDELLGAAVTLSGCGQDEWARLARDAAGELIP